MTPLWPELLKVILGGLIAAPLTFVWTRWATEHRVRYERLQERRTEIIAELYERITKLEESFKEWMRIVEEETSSNSLLKISKEAEEEPEPSSSLGTHFGKKFDDLSEQIREQLKELNSCYLKHAVYFKGSTRQKLDKIARDMNNQWQSVDSTHWGKILTSIESPESHKDEEEKAKQAIERTTLWAKTDLPRARRELEIEFSEYLGVEGLATSWRSRWRRWRASRHQMQDYVAGETVRTTIRFQSDVEKQAIIEEHAFIRATFRHEDDLTEETSLREIVLLGFPGGQEIQRRYGGVEDDWIPDDPDLVGLEGKVSSADLAGVYHFTGIEIYDRSVSDAPRFVYFEKMPDIRFRVTRINKQMSKSRVDLKLLDKPGC